LNDSNGKNLIAMNLRERKLLRLAGYDYAAPGAYFITICVHGRNNEFGIVAGEMMELNEYGSIIEQQWKWLFDQYDYLQIDEYCVMPNHFHGIIWITAPVGDRVSVGNGRDRSLRDRSQRDRSQRDRSQRDRSQRDIKIKPIPELIGAFKTTSSKLIHRAGNEQFKWQKSYYDVIIRDNESLQRIREYIRDNPKHWAMDDYFNKHFKR